MEYYWCIASEYTDYPMHEAKPGPKAAFCRGCRKVVAGWYPRRTHAALPEVTRAVRILTEPGHVAVIHASLWRQVAQHCPDAIIGPVTVRSGDIDKFTLDWVTVLLPEKQLVHVRGTLRSDGIPARRVCDVCGRQCYFAPENPHLVRCQLPKPGIVFMDHVCRLIIAESLAETLDWRGYPDMVNFRLPVLERPLDGLRLIGDPDWTTMGTN